jgi:UDP-N-acetylmuramoyl-tripeptide--D-alanyl-D-alanine ligase
MGEVGDQGIAFHQEAGNEAASLGVGILYTLGQLSSHAHPAFVKSGKISQHFEDAPALIAHLQNSAIEPGSTVLVKGSRFMKMERMVDALVGSKNSAAGGH